jgi:hypothetical protein
VDAVDAKPVIPLSGASPDIGSALVEIAGRTALTAAASSLEHHQRL